MPVHYHQANAAQTGFDDASFDLVTSHILFHETSAEILPEIMAEARRILAPGGVFFNADVPYQPHRLGMPKRVTNGVPVRLAIEVLVALRFEVSDMWLISQGTHVWLVPIMTLTRCLHHGFPS